MIFNKHSDLEGKHSFLSPSQYYWLGYSPDKLAQVYRSHLAAIRGTALHKYAADSINLGIKLPRTHQTLNMYVNDAIGYRMTPEQVLRYSNNAFGTTDAISFNKNLLRIHDLKTGVTPAKMEQLFIYAAQFCLEYDIRPGDIEMETRIYQCDEIHKENPTADIIAPIMDKIVTADKIITDIQEECGMWLR